MLSLRTTAISQQTAHHADATAEVQSTERLVWSELETTPWEGLHFRSNR